MTRRNQILIDDDYQDFICISCDSREFSSEQGLLQHCRNARVHRGEWCERCMWLFVSTDARTAHVRDSLNHWACHLCHTDEDSQQNLVSHMVRAHSYCYDCECSFNSYEEHRIRYHCRCRDCGMEFDNSNNLTMHLQVHLPRNKECYGCVRKFGAVSAMLIHLESGACMSGVAKEEIDAWAFQCYQHNAYTNDWDDHHRFRCPDCDENFTTVSGLLQHVESPTCNAGYHGAIEKLRYYLAKRVTEFEQSYDSDESY